MEMDETNDGYKADNLNDRAWLMAGLAAFNRNPRLATFKKCADRDAGLPTLVSTGRVPLCRARHKGTKQSIKWQASVQAKRDPR